VLASGARPHDVLVVPRARIGSGLAAGVLACLLFALFAAPARAEVPVQPPSVVSLPAGDAEALLLKTWTDKASVTFEPVGGQPPAGTDLRLGVVVKQGLANADWQKSGKPPEVTLFVTAAVPSLVGLRRGDAAALVARHGLVLVAGASPRAVDTWVVARQSPEPGTQAQWGARVVVGLVPPSAAPVTVPDLRGLTRAEAQSAVQAAGLTLTASGPDDGRVAAQDPAASTEVQPGTAVTVTLRVELAASTPAPSTAAPVPPQGVEPWVPVVMVTGGGALLLLVLLLLVFLLRARGGRRPRWVRANVRAVARPAPFAAPEVRLSGSAPTRTVRVRTRADAGSHEFEEVGHG
jgi:beta-lactam-binding protein with PASTA domain